MAPCVFISSTIDDLKAYREAAAKGARRAEFSVRMCEDFPASQHKRPLDLCRDHVAEADVLVVISGHRYGWTPPDTGEKSITWMECEAALAKPVEVLPFLVDPDYRGLDEWKEFERLRTAHERGEDIVALAAKVQRNDKKLAEFKSWLSDDALKFHRKKFRSADNLELEVFAALEAWRSRSAKFRRTAPAPPPPEGNPAIYRAWLANLTGFIDIRGLSVGSAKAARYPIDEVYIPLMMIGPAAADRHRPEAAEGRSVDLDKALEHSRLVIIGDPGSGKTTFLRHAAWRMARETAGSLPFYLRIGELLDHIHKRGGAGGVPTSPDSSAWLADYLATRSAEGNWTLSKDFLLGRMRDGQATLLLDGLDEAPDESARRSASSLFENAVRDYAHCRFVVTTRPHSYTDKVRLPGFHHVHIAPLDEQAMIDALRRWSNALHAGGGGAPAEEHFQELLRAIRERKEIRDMAATPVMLTALAVVHWNDRKLPEQRAELYESIITWLAEQRERRHGRAKPAQCLECLEDLALAMQQTEAGREESVPVEDAAGMIRHRFETVKRAAAFLEDEMNDSGIIMSRAPNLTFWHPTFREFLAARAIGNKPDEDQYKLLLAGGVLHNPEWRELVLLYSGVLSRKRVDAFVSRVLDDLGAKATLANKARVAGLLGAIVHDLTPRDYKPEDPRYGETLRAVMDIFDAAKSESVPFEDRLAAAEALGPGGDPRLERDNWVPIPAGSFRMGSNDFRNQKPPYDVYLDAFEIGRFPVTVQEFAKFVDGRGYQDRRWWKHEAPGERNAPDAWQDQLARPNHPVTRVSWFEAAAYCQWLSDYTGRRVRLPTEAEWERAACGGLKRKYPWGDPEPDSGRANFREGGLGGTTPVGLYPSGSSPEGVLDMAGNVWEWVADWYGKYNYQRSPRRNPLGPDSGRYRAFRGGSWLVVAFHLRVSVRIWDVPGFRVDDLGFRCARDVIVP